MIDSVSISVFLAAVAGLVSYLIVKHLRIKLRQPPPGYLEIVSMAYKNGAPLPATIKTPQLRRQLILASRKPSEFSNLRDMNVQFLDLDTREKRPLIYGFLHPKADGGGGGERVLWIAVKQLLTGDKSAVAALYVGAKPGMVLDVILKQVAERFGIQFSRSEADRIVLVALTQSWLVEPEYYKSLTLLFQAVGMMVLGYEAISNLMPDVLIDTTGLAFSYPVVHYLAQIPVLAYVHYPFVQSEMLKSIQCDKFGITTPRKLIKYGYYKILNYAYNWVGSFTSIVTVNSTWTKQHLGWYQAYKATTIYPPCATQDFQQPRKEIERTNALVYLAQFRPEKRQRLVISAFAKAKAAIRNNTSIPKENRNPHLILIGSVRDELDAIRVHELRGLATDRGLTDSDYTIVENAPWEAVRNILSLSNIGLNAMWNEHFGMSVVEVMGAGLIPIVHASGGPLLDIVKDSQGAPGFFFKSKLDPNTDELNGYDTLSEAIIKALSLDKSTQYEYRMRAWQTAQKFSDAAFSEQWQEQLKLVSAKQLEFARRRKSMRLYD